MKRNMWPYCMHAHIHLMGKKKKKKKNSSLALQFPLLFIVSLD